jgi:alpha-glucosidase (family GH31 glycosyl hydrolase)
MGNDSLIDKEDLFWQDMEDVLLVCVKKDRTVSIKTSIEDMEDLKGVLATLYSMALFQQMKQKPVDGVDRMH